MPTVITVEGEHLSLGHPEDSAHTSIEDLTRKMRRVRQRHQERGVSSHLNTPVAETLAEELNAPAALSTQTEALLLEES